MSKRKRILCLLAIALLVGMFVAIALISSADEVDFKPKMSVTMADSLIFNVYIPEDERIQQISVDGVVKDISALPEKDGYRHIKIPFDACDADREVNLSVVLDENGEKINGSFTLSVVKYASKLLSADESETTKKLVKDILAYINSAKKFFGEESSEEIDALLGSYESAFNPVSAENTANGLKSASFVLGAKPSVRFYIADGYTASDFAFTRGDEALSFKTGSDEIGNYMEISSSAYAMIETISYTVKGSDTVGKYNLSSYCDYVMNEYNESDKALLLDLAKKFYNYCESAAAYRKEVIISMCEHSYSSSVKEKATPTEEGIMEYTCSKCGHSYEERIPTTLKLLAIGNSFSEDAFAHMYIVAKSAGVENVVLGNLYEGGCSLDTHWKFMSGDLAEYNKFYVSSDETCGMIVESTNATAKHAITYTDWDYISIQQASNQSGLPEKYGNLQNVIDYINANKTSDAKLLWQMTWAYQQDSTHSGFASYNNDQMTMYNSIVNTVKEVILTNDAFYGVIPVGTSVQNLRTSVLEDTLTRDGYHLSMGIGRYTNSLTWIAYLTGCDVDKITATPSSYPEVASSLDYIKDAVKKAIANPYGVTESAYPAPPKPEEPETPESDKLLNTTLSPLTDSDREYLVNNGFDPDRYMILDFEIAANLFYNSTHSSKYADRETQATTSSQYMKWWSTQIFSKDELITGSVIRLDAGTKYRPEGWINMQKNSKRPDVVTADTDYYITVDDAWWGSYNYRGFNIGKSNGSAYTQAEYDAYANDPSTLPFKIYIPIVKRAELTADDRAYLESQGLNPDSYKVLDFEYFVDYHYNSSLRGAVASASTGSVQYKYVATEVFSKYDLTIGTIIRLTGANHNYRPDGWTEYSAKYTGTRPVAVSATKTVIDIAWWGEFAYRGINIQNKGGTAENPVSAADASVIRIYVPIETNGLTADDRAYLESLGLNPDEYKVLELDFKDNSYYNSTTGFTRQSDKETGSNYCKYISTQVFSKSELTNGSVIRIDSGYKYRPDGWKDSSTITAKADRPATVTTTGIIINDAWWGEFTLRGFNINKTSGETITAEEGVNFKIYVKIA